MINKEKQNATRVRWRDTHKEERRAYEAKWRREHKENQRRASKKYNQELKLQVLSHYSLTIYPICAHCGIADVDVLCLDHIEGGGSENRRKGIEKSGESLYAQLRIRGYPIGFQVLCSNCNLKKLITEGF